MCRKEAAELSKLEPTLSKVKVPLIAVLHEELGNKDFMPFFQGSVFFDPDKIFFGPVERRLFLLGFLRIETYISGYKAHKSGTQGNFVGDGTLLGGVFVIGPGDTGIIFEHREKFWGDYVNTSDVLQAVEKISTTREA